MEHPSDEHPLTTILRCCAAADPRPWFPSQFAKETGIPRDSLDPHLDALRLGGYIRFEGWEKGLGQGCVLTEAGREFARDECRLATLQRGVKPLKDADADADPYLMPRPTNWRRGEAADEAFHGFGPTPVTNALLAANLAVFAAGYFLAWQKGLASAYLDGSPLANRVFLTLGSLSSIDVHLQGQYWRLLTNCFVHIGIVHLASNMISLLLVGPFLERLWGSGAYATIYFLAGFGGSCAMLAERPVLANGAGASGAIWGILASLAAWLWLNRDVLRPQILASYWQRLVLVFAINLYITFAVAQISKGAHLGGGIVGFLAAFPLDTLRFGSPVRRLLAAVLLCLLPIVCLAFAIEHLRRHEPHVVAFAKSLRLQQSRAEIDQFNNEYMDAINAAIRAEREVNDGGLREVVEMHWSRRRPTEVSRALERAAEAKQKVDAMIERLRAADQFTNDLVVQARNDGLAYLESARRLLELQTACLVKAENWTDADEAELREAFAERKRAFARWMGEEPGDDSEP